MKRHFNKLTLRMKIPSSIAGIELSVEAREFITIAIERSVTEDLLSQSRLLAMLEDFHRAQRAKARETRRNLTPRKDASKGGSEG